MSERVTILGAGAMSTVCAMLLLSDTGKGEAAEVCIWSRRPESTERLRHNRDQSRLLPGARIPDAVRLTSDPQEALSGATLIVSAIPTQYIRGAWGDLVPHVPTGERVAVVSVAKGIECGTLLRPTEIIADVLRKSGHAGIAGGVAMLSGPNIAAELARGLPASAVAASSDEALARRVQLTFARPLFRVYTNSDLLGVELAGATKNIIAIAAGILDGLGAGNNAKAALVTRGLVEITRLGVAMGARVETFQGLAGLGDLLTTCVSPEGRNRSVGERIGRGMTLKQALATTDSVAEGVPTTRSVRELARRCGVEMPITETLYEILFDDKDVRVALGELMGREHKREH